MNDPKGVHPTALQIVQGEGLEWKLTGKIAIVRGCWRQIWYRNSLCSSGKERKLLKLLEVRSS
jgi:hypothetical protein